MSDFGTLKQRLGRRRGFDGNVDRLGGFINDAYLTLCSRRPTWSWLRRTLQFNTTGKLIVVATAGPPLVDGATFTNGSTTVTLNGTPIQDTNTGAKMSCPDTTIHRIRGGNQAGTSISLESPFSGTTTAAVAPHDSFSIYFDEYPLPPEATVIESLVATGNGWSVPVVQQSMLSPHMKAMPVSNDESYPRYYSVERHNTVPPPMAAPVLSVTGPSSGLAPDTTHYYAYAYFNSRTLEMGPLSPTVAASTTSTDRTIQVTFIPRSDYRVVLYRSLGIPNGTYSSGVASRTALVPELYHLINMNSGDGNHGDGIPDSALGYSVTNDIAWWAERGMNTSGQQHIRLWPPPDKKYLVDISYFIAPKMMSLDSDVPATPRVYQNVILDLAESLCLSEEENHGAAAQKRSYALEMIQRMERDDNVDPATSIQIGRGTMDPYEAILGGGRWPRDVTG